MGGLGHFLYSPFSEADNLRVGPFHPSLTTSDVPLNFFRTVVSYRLLRAYCERAEGPCRTPEEWITLRGVGAQSPPGRLRRRLLRERRLSPERGTVDARHDEFRHRRLERRRTTLEDVPGGRVSQGVERPWTLRETRSTLTSRNVLPGDRTDFRAEGLRGKGSPVVAKVGVPTHVVFG